MERAKLNLAGASADERTVDALIGAYSDAIVKWCRREFWLRAYDEMYNGLGGRHLMLRQYPLVSVESVRYRPVTVLKVINNDQSTNQQARVQVTDQGLQLVRVASGVRVVDTSVTYATYLSLTALAAAVTALGAGWSAQIVGDSGGPGQIGDYGLWPSSDLYVTTSYGTGTTSRGALTCRGVYAELKMHTYELQGYDWDPRGWLLRAIPYTDPELLHPEDLIWPVGINNFRVQYTAGYTTIPEAVQEACARWVAHAYYLTQRDPSITNQVTAAGTAVGYASAPTGVGGDPPGHILPLIKTYRRISITNNQG